MNRSDSITFCVGELFQRTVFHTHSPGQSVKPREDAADVVQEVFRALAHAIAGFKYSRTMGTFRGWLRTITKNKINDHFWGHAGRALAVGGTNA